ncbi:hypothetical protein [Aestuariispira insulae]|uniref:Uncharacterized protein n=1 Tax=Aestuariispira insulae TaxID=1461337 RepID=A0A3D9HV35_9PROT|nr:hypothetical protein [Aestuariispira insulae]RED53352.1 hypothetical protein DFP90_101139 [Aestuariispira insulae]
MTDHPKIVTRIIIGKLIGAAFGAGAFFLLPDLGQENSLMLKWGFFFWYITFGAIIGIMGIFDHHPVLRIPMPWWLRAPAIGAWLNLVLTLITYDLLQRILASYFPEGSALQSPFWFVLEGAVLGLIIGYVATRFGGEGYQTVTS